MARLNNNPASPPLPHPKRKHDTRIHRLDQGSDVQPLERVYPPSKPTPPSLAIEVQPKLDPEKVFNDTDLSQFLDMSNIDEALELGEQIIIKRLNMAEAGNAQCAWDIFIVWRLVEKIQAEHSGTRATIQDWQKKILQQLQRNGKDITSYLQLADEALLRLSAHGKRIYDSWGVLPTQVLPKDKYDTMRQLSQSLLQAMVRLTNYVNLEEARRLLLRSINRRQDENSRSPWDRRVPYLVISDLQAVNHEQQTKKKRGRTSEEDAMDSSSARAESRSIKRQKGSFNTKDEEEDEEVGEEEEYEEVGKEESVEDVGEEEEDEEVGEEEEDEEVGEEESVEENNEDEDETNAESGPCEAVERAAEEDTRPCSFSIVTTGEMLDENDRPEIQSDMSIDLPREAHSKSDYESPTTLPLTSSNYATPMPSPIRLSHAEHVDQAYVTPELELKMVTLYPGQMLSSSVIQETVALCIPTDCLLIDPLYFDSDFPDRDGMKKQLTKSIKRIFIPLHDPQLLHWSLAVLNLESRFISIYDTLHRDQTAASSLAQRLRKFGTGIIGSPQHWTFQSIDCPKQSNGTDCGIHVIANALFLMTDNDLPKIHDCSAWRLICRALLGEEDIPLDILERFRSPVEIGHLQEVAGVHDFQLRTPSESSLVTGLREIKKMAGSNLSALQGQQFTLQALCDSTGVIVTVLETVHHRLDTETCFLSDQLVKDQQLLERHEDFIQQHYIRSESPSSPDDSTVQSQDSEELLATLRMAQASMTKQLEKKAANRKAVQDRLLKSKNLVIVARQIQARYGQELGLSDSAKERVRGTVQNWRNVIAQSLSGIDEILGSWES